MALIRVDKKSKIREAVAQACLDKAKMDELEAHLKSVQTKEFIPLFKLPEPRKINGVEEHYAFRTRLLSTEGSIYVQRNGGAKEVWLVDDQVKAEYLEAQQLQRLQDKVTKLADTEDLIHAVHIRYDFKTRYSDRSDPHTLLVDVL